MLKVGVTGVRGYAEVHHAQISRMEEAGSVALRSVVIPEIHGAKDASAEDLDALERRGIRVFETLTEMISRDDTLDVVFLPVGIPLHHTLAIQCLEAGIHVVCEKPMTGSCAQADAMMAARDRSRKRLVLAFQHMYHPSVDFLRGLVASSSYGRLLRADTLVLWPRDSAYFSRNTWAGRFDRDGVVIRDCPLNNACAHFMQNMLYVASAPGGIAAEASVGRADNYHSAPIDTADTQDVEVAGPDGLRLRMIVSHACVQNENAFTVFQFEQKHVYWLQEGQIFLADPGPMPRFSDRTALSEAAAEGAYGVRAVFDGTTYSASNEAFDAMVRGIEDDTPLPSDASQCRAHVHIVEQALPNAEAVRTMPGTEERRTTRANGTVVQRWIRPGIEQAAHTAFCSNEPLSEFL